MSQFNLKEIRSWKDIQIDDDMFKMLDESNTDLWPFWTIRVLTTGSGLWSFKALKTLNTCSDDETMEESFDNKSVNKQSEGWTG